MSESATDAIEARQGLGKTKRLIVKIGSKALASGREVYDRLAEGAAAAQASRRHVTIVSSGAIALGMKRLGVSTRPKEMALLQAAAAVGQNVLMHTYEEAFARRGLTVAQILLTHADLADRARANNARDALVALLDAKVVPIINENDTVAVEEIRFGENDLLASMVVPLISADLLVLLSDIPGLLDEQRQRVPVVRSVNREARHLAKGPAAGPGTGGMASKVEAARRATLAGASVVVADARLCDPIGAVLRGEDVGTLFLPHPQRIQARKHWIAFTLRPRGAILLDRGAVEAVVGRGRSVLPVGVVGVRGDFSPGDAVALLTQDGREIARGLARLGAAETAAIAGKRGQDLAAVRGHEPDVVVVHRDDLVLAQDD